MSSALLGAGLDSWIRENVRGIEFLRPSQQCFSPLPLSGEMGRVTLNLAHLHQILCLKMSALWCA